MTRCDYFGFTSRLKVSLDRTFKLTFNHINVHQNCAAFQFSFFSSEISSFFPNILPFNFASAALILPTGPVLFFESTASNLREERLWKEPKAMATTVHARQMTLYGILKSGVGRVISRISVWRRRNIFSSGAALALKDF